MRPLKIRALSVLLGACYCLSVSAPALADDTEIFGTGGSFGAGLKPNILFIVDTSGSMDGDVVTHAHPYDATKTYGGGCSNGNVYWRQDLGKPPACNSNQNFPLTLNYCNAATQAFARDGRYVAASAGMWNSANGRKRWENLRAGVNNEAVECKADAGAHGDGLNATKLWAWNSGDNATKWTATASQGISWTSNNTNRTYVLYTGNWLNWYYDTSDQTIKSRLDIVKEVTTSLANSIDDVNLGLMRYSNNDPGGNNDSSAEGGMVTKEVGDIATTRAAIIASVNSYQPSGFTPLSETLYEAGQYLAGRNVDFGLTSRLDKNTPFPSIPASRQTGNQAKYQSPISYSCQKNYVVYLTDGEPTQDNHADTKITSLPNFATLTGSTDCDDTGPGRCMDDMAEYLFKADLSPTLAGTQNAITYTIGFGPEVATSGFLEKVAQRGGGKAYSAEDTATLENVLTNIVTEILQTNTSFTSPSVSVNAFNRTQTLNDIYVSLFRPSEDYHWPGNVKKYQVVDSEIVDGNGNSAIDPNTGNFRDTAKSFWSPTPDGGAVDVGGAASQLPLPAVRNVYTYLGTNTALTSAVNAVAVTNAGITDAILGLGTPGMPTRVNLIEWIRGRDVQDDNQNGDFTEPRLAMGDPIHAKPAVVIYGGSAGSPNLDDAAVLSITNDGYLHSVDVRTGRELWSFIPKDMLAIMPALYENATQVDKHYTLDGDLRVFKLDRNNNGVVEPLLGDKVYLYFGMRRGGNSYYALDITSRLNPVFMWTIGPTQLPGVGETWSTPTVAKVTVGGTTQNADKFVLIFGGGYADNQDNPGYSVDALGNRVYMIDAVTGTLLWYAGGAGIGSPNLSLTSAPSRMNNSIPADIAVLDVNNDGFADRMYTGDMGGRVWRFDITSGNSASTLVTGGVIASLGAGDTGSPALNTVRRFYNAPDVALVRNRSGSYYAVAIGTGYRGHPLNTVIRDRFYLIKDKLPFQARTQAQYNALTPIVDTGLVNVTDNLNATVTALHDGWKLELRDGASSWIGEKSLSSPTIFNGRVFFTTYLPPIGAPIDPCTPGLGTNRAFVVSLLNGAPVANLDGQASASAADRYIALDQGGIAPETVFLFPGKDPNDDGNGSCTGPNCVDGEGSEVTCINGTQILLGVCFNSDRGVRTFWQESGTN